MPERKTITVPDPVYEELDTQKPDDLSWGAFLSGLVSDTELVTNEDIMARLDDLQVVIPRETADKVENRMTRR